MPNSNLLDELLRHLRRSPSQDPDRESRKLVEWLRQRIDADVTLVDGEGAVELSTGGLSDADLESLRPVLDQVSGGRLAAAAMQVGPLHVRCEGLGSAVPRPVLLVASASRLTPEATALASHTGTVLDALRRIGSFADLASRHTKLAHRLRVAVFMALMVGDPALARRMTADAVPPLLEAERLRVLLLRCPPGDRIRLVESRQDELGYHGRGLLVRCPVFDEHVICLVAADDAEAGDGGLEALLRTWVRDNPGYALGISAPLPLRSTEAAYDQARQALAVARRAPGRVAGYRGQVALARILPRREALAWALETLRPIGSAPRLTVEVLRLSLGFPRSGVARLLGISRNTVTAHLRRAENALGVDLGSIDDRARLALALAITDPRPVEGAREPRSPIPSMDDLLTDEAAVSWARTFVQPFQDEENRLIYEAVRCWVDAGTDAQRAARVLGISRNTVGARLRVAERLLDRDLLVPSPGIHDLFHALAIVKRAPELE